MNVAHSGTNSPYSLACDLLEQTGVISGECGE